MEGYGANHVLLPPSEVVVVRFMDEYAMDVSDLIQRVAKQVPLQPVIRSRSNGSSGSVVRTAQLVPTAHDL